jgi:hypothetical protein
LTAGPSSVPADGVALRQEYMKNPNFKNINLGVIILITGFCLDKKINGTITLNSDLLQ